jgi:HEAT repeat protein
MDWTGKSLPLRPWGQGWIFFPALLVVALAFAAANPKPILPLLAIEEPQWDGWNKWDRWDSLFIIAATGEPRWQALRDSCEKELLSRSDATVEMLLARRLVDQTPRQRRYVERLFGLMSDSGRNKTPGIALRSALNRVDDSIKAQLLYVASTMADSNLLDLGHRFIQHEKPEIRRMAARVLGMLRHASSPEKLLPGINLLDEKERHQRAWALAELAPFPGCETLKELAGDPSLAVRQMISHALSRCAQGKMSKLNLSIPRLGPGDRLPVTPWLTYLDAAKEIGTPESLAFAEAILAKLPEETRRFYRLDSPK